MWRRLAVWSRQPERLSICKKYHNIPDDEAEPSVESPATGVPTSHLSKPGPRPHCLAQTAEEIADNDRDLLSGASEVREAAVEHKELSCAQPTQRQPQGNLSPCRHSETVWIMFSSYSTDICRWILSLLWKTTSAFQLKYGDASCAPMDVHDARLRTWTSS